ncbi:hypothetical protein FIBSPDRAFT_859341 [Athelia psychrophila]|uniref:Uncharacterized protein n=1 Tax=Athelia psychrophila TaxID=1759441 RepID=A0A166C7K5_9AGAM|nr:hypothetical protein FIBSPDRAFT_869381 [Fibularhizoctonia sp. CBS 109695]KZP22553.1 hypothetical protein FIBSPDRAFT_859341 [Fibularhizoctonia sp. CBS 109695]
MGARQLRYWGNPIIITQHHPRPLSRFMVPSLLTCADKTVLARIIASPNMPCLPFLFAELDGSSS